MSRRGRRENLEDTSNLRGILYLGGGILGVAIIVFVLTFVVYDGISGNKTNNKQVAKNQNITDMVNQQGNNVTKEASGTISKGINEVQNMTNSTSEIIIQNATDSMPEVTGAALTGGRVQGEEPVETSADVNIVKAEEKKEVVFSKPVEGDITKGFAKDTLLYSETLKEWMTHFGVDVAAERTSVVKAAADGKVKSIKSDPRYGLTIVIEHEEGFTTVYANLLTTDFVKEGEVVKLGQTIGTVGNTASFESMDASHLHFEIIKDGDYVDPCVHVYK